MEEKRKTVRILKSPVTGKVVYEVATRDPFSAPALRRLEQIDQADIKIINEYPSSFFSERQVYIDGEYIGKFPNEQVSDNSFLAGLVAGRKSK